MDPKMKPIKKPTINQPPHQRTPNDASPSNSPTINGNNQNHDKDYSKWGDLSPGEVNKLHARDDVDVSFRSHHHTLGIKSGQAAPGDHIHNGVNSKRIGAKDGNVLSGAKGGNVALTNLIAILAKYIDFSDTTT